jgi:hypothetical protein
MMHVACQPSGREKGRRGHNNGNVQLKLPHQTTHYTTTTLQQCEQLLSARECGGKCNGLKYGGLGWQP